MSMRNLNHFVMLCVLFLPLCAHSSSIWMLENNREGAILDDASQIFQDENLSKWKTARSYLNI